MSGQWRYDFQGPRALDYGPLFVLMGRMGLSPEAWDDMFADIRVIEHAALDRMAKK